MLGSLGLHQAERPASEIRVGFRTGWLRALTISLGGAGILGAAGTIIGLAEKQPEQFFGEAGALDQFQGDPWPALDFTYFEDLYYI